MSRAKQTPKRKHRACAVPLLGAAGLSLALASGTSVGTGGPAAAEVGHELTLGEEEISDVSLATFYVFDKENARTPGLQLARGGGGGGCARAGVGCAHAAVGCARAGSWGGCSHGGCRGCHGGCHRGCRGCHGGCGGCGCWWGGGWWGDDSSCWLWTSRGWVWTCSW
jgi:hypothetical protein